MAKKILTIIIEVDDKIEAYKAVAKLDHGGYKIIEISWDKEHWIFENSKNIKYFLNRQYINQETGEEIKL